MIRLRWREVQRVQWRWIGPFDMASPLRAPGVGAVAAIIGPAGPAGGETVMVNASRALSGHRAVVRAIAGAAYPDGAVALDAEAIFGVTTGAAAQGSLVTVQRTGEMEESSWSWSPGPVFASHDGLLTQSPLSSGTAWLRQVGTAFAPTRLVLDLRPVIRL